MNLDEKIKQELENEAEQLDQILAHEPGLFAMLLNTYKGALGGWMILISIITLSVSGVMVWAGYEFFFSAYDLDSKLHWGVVLLLSTMVQIALKMWMFMEMNRESSIREIKRVELLIERLSVK
jgi:uncharacterized membrane protein